MRIWWNRGPLKIKKPITDIVYELKRSKRKSVSVEISRDAKVVVRAPLKMKKDDIDAFVEEKRDWINTNLSKMEEILKDAPEKLTDSELKALKKSARKMINERAEYFASLMGVSYNGIAVRAQKTRFGSCSSKKNLNFNIALALMPQEIMDYVIVHELAHLKEMNHSARFWSEVERLIPDYKKRRAWLMENGLKYIRII